MPDPARIVPAPGQESAWEYPGGPTSGEGGSRIEIEFNGQVIVDTRRAVRVLETSHPPVYYIPPEEIADGVLSRAAGASFCEWKGGAIYWTVTVGERSAEAAAWSYPGSRTTFERWRTMWPSIQDEWTSAGWTEKW